MDLQYVVVSPRIWSLAILQRCGSCTKKNQRNRIEKACSELFYPSGPKPLSVCMHMHPQPLSGEIDDLTSIPSGWNDIFHSSCRAVKSI